MALFPDVAEALAQHQAGQVRLAETGYRRALAARPDDSVAAYLLSMLILQRLTPEFADLLNLIDRFLAAPAELRALTGGLASALGDALQFDRMVGTFAQVVEAEGDTASPGAASGAVAARLQSLTEKALDQQVGALRAVGREPDDRTIFTQQMLAHGAAEAGAFFGDQLASLNKSRGFMADAKFMAAFERNARSTGEEPGRAWRLHTLAWAARQALALEGDFVECGVFEGFLSASLCEYLDFAGSGRTFYLYDTFEGFAARYSSREDFGEHHKFFDLAQGIYSRPGLYETVVERFRPYPNVKVIRGVVPDVLLDEAPERIAYCHIDLNSPAAEVGALKVLFDRIVPGGMVVFDDYGWLPFAKQKEAEDAWAAQRGYSILELPTGQGLLVKR